MFLASSLVCYTKASDFLDDLRKQELRQNFTMSEEVFRELVAVMATEEGVAELISERAVVIALAAAKGQEVEALLEMAEIWRTELS